ncbi:hypothetical protein E4U60_006957 [Claviceps pazoutovae]|uniref:Uncharacterized protein n=1 Tax=Claviceps pazoutovae TaxID=1649127 RepID=A0A9P7MGG6_9HYPO|nr:hypothetical protein E4U60_006957 [Claviceps pazoutovae]
MGMRLEVVPGIEVGVVCEPRAGVDSEVDVDGNPDLLILTVGLISDRPDKLNITPDNAGPGSMVKAEYVDKEPGLELDATSELDASLDPDKVDSVTGSVKVVGREDARPDETRADEMRLELIAEPGVAAEPDKPGSVEIDCELGTRADNDVPDDAVTDEMKEPCLYDADADSDRVESEIEAA